MAYELPAHGEANWDTKLNASIEAVKLTSDAAQPAATLEADVAATVGTGGDLDEAITSLVGTPINVMEHGIGTGGSDDAAAWNALFNAIGTNATLIAPAGMVSRILTAISVPASKTGFTLIGYGATLELDPAASSGTTMMNLAPDNAKVIGLRVNGSAATNSTGIRPKGTAKHQRILACDFLGCVAGGVHIQDSPTHLTIAQCSFEGAGYGILTDSAATPDHLTIDANTFRGGSSGDAIEINTPTTGATNVSITNNRISGYTNTSASGIGIGLARVVGGTISNNIVIGCGLDGIHIEDDSRDISVTGNRIYDCDRAGMSLQIGAGAGAAPSSISIIGNTVRGCAGSAGTGGIALEGGTALNNIEILGNQVHDNGRTGATCYGIDLGASGVGHRVIGNTVTGTLGSATNSVGIRWSTATSYAVHGNRCTGQAYGLRAYGVNTDVSIIGNYLTGNSSSPIDEGSISGASTGYEKRYNRPSGIDTGARLPIFAGTVSDASFGTVVPLNGAAAIDSTNGRAYFKYNNAWHYVTLT